MFYACVFLSDLALFSSLIYRVSEDAFCGINDGGIRAEAALLFLESAIAGSMQNDFQNELLRPFNLFAVQRNLLE